jgi:hypothetical protein
MIVINQLVSHIYVGDCFVGSVAKADANRLPRNDG